MFVSLSKDEAIKAKERLKQEHKKDYESDVIYYVKDNLKVYKEIQ